MSPVTVIVYICIVFVMLLFSAFFSGSEISFNSASRMRLSKAASEKVRFASLALRISERFTTALCAILIGNNLANIAATTCATSLFIVLFKKLFTMSGIEGVASTVSTVVMTLIVLVFGEILPKIISRKYADKVVLWVALPVRILTVVLFPLVAVVMGLLWLLRKLWGRDNDGTAPDVTEDELSSIIDTVEEEGVIDEGQSELLQSSLEFHETTIEEIMTPRIDLVSIDINDDQESIREIIENSIYSRIPVYDDSIDDIIGILFLNHYFKEAVDNKDVDLRPLLMKPLFLHKTMRLPAALHHLRDRKTHIAIVIDEFGGTLGVVTVEDILEEIVGDIWDESDEIVEEMVAIGDHKYEVSGDMNIDDFFSELDYYPKDFECDYSTVGGWAIENLNSDPHVGDVFEYEDLHVLVSEMEDEVRVTKLIVSLAVREDEDGGRDEE
jgi:CBS domain containing-hemolysin-like protein